MDDFRKRGFLPAVDPLTRFPPGSPGTVLDDLGAELPTRLEDSGFRNWLRAQHVPDYATVTRGADQAVKHLFYVRVGFLASAYINQIGAPPARRLPANLAVPLCAVCADLQRPPILSYAGYALYNWRRLDPSGPVALGNIDTIQNFVELFDEHWFILVHVDIEARAAAILDAVLGLEAGNGWRNRQAVDAAVGRIADTVRAQTEVLRRIPEHMSLDRYFSGFRPYIRLFDQVVYDGVDRAPVSFRGETGAQSSVLPLLDAFFKIPHEVNALTRHLSDLRRYMPPSHRALLAQVAGCPDIRRVATPEVFDDALSAIADFRGVHFGWAVRYIAEQADETTAPAARLIYSGSNGFVRKPWPTAWGQCEYGSLVIEEGTTMEYAFECRKCGERFHVTESLAEHDEHREKCPKCGSREVEQRIERVHVKTARKS